MFRNACEVDVTLEAPYYANNTRNEPLALLNLYPFEQYVHMERCKSEYDEMLCRPGCRLILKLLICCLILISTFDSFSDVSSSIGCTDY